MLWAILSILLEKLFLRSSSVLRLDTEDSRLAIANASREAVRIWRHKFSKLYNPSKKHRRLVAVDEAVVKVNGYRCYLWAAIDVDSRRF
ncbi:MAG: hypothetical protein B9J98_02755 [Candidatus Terraquivivens tikiterensis]|uniref:DDE domain-containing protein n=1 Tax=Candidatus Terraquivivens tikiterensis TaxID=1980982 RepID=A0A2R7Y659_9ARCH|nr:MAG: hypothetical protein B9J98_02755 [Candidatus Terraquivivens tikiterensis]